MKVGVEDRMGISVKLKEGMKRNEKTEVKKEDGSTYRKELKGQSMETKRARKKTGTRELKEGGTGRNEKEEEEEE